MSYLGFARLIVRRFGLDVTRADPLHVDELRLVELLKRNGVETVLDIGANDGRFGTLLYRAGWTGHVISFEPLPEAWSRLRLTAHRRPGWSVAPPMALSNFNGEANFHESANSVSSSLLNMAAAHVEAAPESRIVSDHLVTVRRLDDVLREIPAEGPLFLKLDVQGAERMVLDGAAETLASRVVGVQVEMSLATLYRDGASATDLDGLLRASGFECWDIQPVFRDPESCRLLQYDGIYMRSGGPDRQDATAAVGGADRDVGSGGGVIGGPPAEGLSQGTEARILKGAFEE